MTITESHRVGRVLLRFICTPVNRVRRVKRLETSGHGCSSRHKRYSATAPVGGPREAEQLHRWEDAVIHHDTSKRYPR